MTPADTGDARVFRFEKVLEHPFGIASITTNTEWSVLLHVNGSWGEAAPSRIYGETVDSVLAILEKVLPDIPTDGQKPDDFLDWFEEHYPHNRSAMCAVDSVLHDLWARKEGQPLWKLLGAEPTKMPISSFTIGIDEIDVMLDKVEEAAAKSPVLKIKLGRNPDTDWEVMKEIRAAAPDKTLRVDANQGWTLEDAKRLISKFEELGVEYVEQPLRRGEFDKGAELKAWSPLPIYVDEDCHLASGVPELAKIAHGVNAKLVKTGGIREAVRLVMAAREHGLGTMLGCMVETSNAIGAAAQIAPLFDHIDLDGHVLITNDPFVGPGWDNGRLTLTDQMGLGLTVSPDAKL